VNRNDPRVRYAVEVLGDLFPGSAVSEPAARGKDGPRTFAFAPSARRPRLLVPTAPRDAAATALRSYGGRLTRKAQLSYGAVARSLSIAGPAALRCRMTVSPTDENPAAGIDDHLSEVLERQVSIAVHLTPSRANRKPVIQALAGGERYPAAFAKMGVDSLTSRLVEQEARALKIVAAHEVRNLIVPAVVDYGDFAGHGVLTLRPLPTWLPGRSPSLADVAAAAAEVAQLTKPNQGALADSGYWRGVQRRAADLPLTPRAVRLVQCVERITDQLGTTAVTFTASHGDWTPWNMWLTERGLLVWDWERFETTTPAGLDLLHFRLNDRFIRGSWTREDAALQLIAEAPEILAQSDSADPPLHTVLLYLVHLGLRYEADGQAAAGAALGHLETWLLPAVEAGLGDPALRKRL
jgi:Phosphotransferase enzyme family